MSEDLFREHGLHGLHEWPEAQDTALALLTARKEGCGKAEGERDGASAPVRNEESHLDGDSVR